MTKLNTIKIQYNKAIEKYNKELKELQQNCNHLCFKLPYLFRDFFPRDEIICCSNCGLQESYPFDKLKGCNIVNDINEDELYRMRAFPTEKLKLYNKKEIKNV